uniref:Uncharacterized protein n=1 Tax=Glycine max TaxID=3847 RepID=K7MED6_SOYBN
MTTKTKCHLYVLAKINYSVSPFNYKSFLIVLPRVSINLPLPLMLLNYAPCDQLF